MARKSGSTIVQEESYPHGVEHSRVEPPRIESARNINNNDNDLDDARLVDLDVDEESPVLRGQKRVPARRSTLPRKTVNWLLWVSLAAAALCAAGIAAAALYEYGEHSWRFRVQSSDNIEVTGTQNVTKAQIMEVMGGDIGRNIFFIPLAQQKAQLEQIPWVESASVMRFVPNRLKVEIVERTPVAFARVGPHIALIDAGGTLMELPPKRKYSFPVILGMNPGEPLSTRAPRMKVYMDLVRDLDSGGAHYSQDLSEVNLIDLEDVKVRVNDPAGDVLVHLGSSDYLQRYKTYASHVQEWRQQFRDLESVDLRYDNQIVVNPDIPKPARAAAVTSAVVRRPAPAVKPAALVTKMPARVGPHDKPVPKPVFEMTEKEINSNTAVAKPGVKKPAAKAKGNATAKKPTAKNKAAAVPKKAAGAGKPANPAARKTSPAVSRNQTPNHGQGETTAAARKAGAAKSLHAGMTPLAANRGGRKPSPAIAKQQESQAPN
ncbi:MAG: FtsQ-type POTRA domain-containing protein [Candidatus Sulfotelmatobacter sp.]